MASPSPSGTMTSTSSSFTTDPNSIAHAVALGAVVIAPVVMLMPPRKLDLYTFVVAGCGVYGANHLVRERHGVGMMGLAGRRLGIDPSSSPTSPTSPSSLSSSSSSASSSTQSQSSSSSSSPSSLLSSSFFSSPESHSHPGHESSIERFSLPTERARSLHEALAADRANAERRRAAYGELRTRASDIARHGWGAGGDMRRALRVARTAVEEDARRHGWQAPAPDEEKDDAVAPGGRRAEALASAAGAKTRAGRKEVIVGGRGGREDDEEGHDQRGGVAGLVKKVWMGDETEGWKEKRLAEEQKALDEGKGYSDLIADQIWEVWNWDKKKNEDGEWVSKNDAKPR